MSVLEDKYLVYGIKQTKWTPEYNIIESKLKIYDLVDE